MIEANNQLSIVIPTYNRADFLNYSLEVHIPLARRYHIQICIFDNASMDDTEQIVARWMQEYPFLSYHKNETNIGPDANFEKALKYPDTEYVWLLGDTYQIPRNAIEYLLNTINDTEKDFDVIVFNLANTIKVHTKNYQDQNVLLNDLGAVMTCAAINVYNKKLLDNAEFPRYKNTHFIQTGVIFEYIANKPFLIHWAQEHSIASLEHPTLQKTNWSHTPKAFEIGCEDWTNFVMSLSPSYNINNKMNCIMDFGKVSGLFTLKNLVMLRVANLLNYQVFSQYKKLFPLTIDYPSALIYMIAITPRIFFKLIVFFTIVVFKREKVDKIQEIMGK